MVIPRRAALLPCLLILALVTPPLHAAFKAEALNGIDAAVQAAIADHKTPGAVVRLEHAGDVFERVYGNRALVPSPEPATADTIYDAASLTKVIATTTAVMQLIERGRLDLEAPAARYWPEFGAEGKDQITLRQLLTHTSGLRPDLSLKDPWSGTAKALELVIAEKLAHPPGTQFVYSDINFIVLGELVHRVSGQRLDAYTAAEIFRPLKMVDTGFLPAAAIRQRIAPTELTDGIMLRGTVHDPTARRMDGVAGHAGLFTTTADLSRFCRMLLNGGELDGVRILRPETVRLMTQTQTDGTAPRGFFGGGGLLGTALDYVRLTQMLLNGGELDGVRLLSRMTVDLMHSDLLGNLPSASPLLAPGHGFGITVAINKGPAHSATLPAPGQYRWGGMAGTAWWVDPREEMTAVFFMQTLLDLTKRNEFMQLAYQAIVD